LGRLNVTQPAISATEANPRAAKPNLRYGWYVVLVLTAVYMLSFVDRQILGLLVQPIKRDLGISDFQVGLLAGPAFALFYTFMGLPLGRFVDTRNRRNLVVVCIVIWSFFSSSCSAAKTYLTLFFSRMGVGVGEAGLGPAAYSLISDYFPKDRMSAAISVYYMGLFFGSGLAALVSGVTVQALARTPTLTVPLLGVIASWRVTFLVVGLPGLLFALLALTIREPLRKNLLRAADGQVAKISFWQAFGEMRQRWQSVAGISLGMVFQSASTYAITQWTPAFLQRVHGWAPGQTGKTQALILVIFGCSGMYLGGILSDRWQRRGVCEAPLKVSLVAALGIGAFLPAAMLVHSIEWCIVLLAVGVFFLALPMGTMVAALQLIFPNQVRGQVSALFLFILNLGGLNIGPVLPPFLSDKVFHNEKMIGVALAITIGCAAIVMLLIFWATIRPYRIHYKTMEAAESC
jgi:MFS family permease